MKTRFDSSRSIRSATMLLLIAAASSTLACSSDATLTAPASVTRAPTPQPAEVRVTGTVIDDDGAPVAGAKVTIYRWTSAGDARSAATDSKGVYTISLVPADGISAIAEKNGYVSAWQSRSLSPAADCQFDLRIHRIALE